MINSLKTKGKILWNILKPHRRLGFLSAAFVVGAIITALFIYARPAYADDWGVANAIMGAISELFLWLATKLLAVTVFIMKFVIEIASYNNYINSGAVTLGWILVRDVTNMFFVIILMVIAFGTVLGIEAYEWKKLLVKFIMAAVLVNFSRIICGVIIDAAQVFMMTFISGVAAVAGGNLINALQLESILSFSKNATAETTTYMNVVATSIFAFIFSFATVVVMGAYLVVLIGRVVGLWVLVILSPLAFVLSVIPKTQSYANQWWSEFTNNVIVGPVLAFFLWLAFAVAGGANIHSEFSTNSAYPMTDPGEEQAAIMSQGGASEDGPTNLLKIMEFDNLAGFVIAVALLLAGVKVAQKLSTIGAGALGAAGGAVMGFAMAATGVTAAKWAAKEAGGVAKKAAKVPVEFAKKRVESLGYAAKAKAYMGMERWNRMIERQLPGAGKTGISGFLQRRLMFGASAAKMETRKDLLEKQMKKFKTSIGEPETLKQQVANVEAELEVGTYIKEKVKAERKRLGLEAAMGKKTIAPPDKVSQRFLGERPESTLGTVALTAAAKTERMKEEMESEHSIELAAARDRAAKNTTPIYENAARQAIFKKKMEQLYNPLNYEQTMTRVDELSNKYDALSVEQPKESDEQRKNRLSERRKVGEELNMAQAAAHAKGAGMAKDVNQAIYQHLLASALSDTKPEQVIGHAVKRKDVGDDPAAVRNAVQEAANNEAPAYLRDLQAQYLSTWLHKAVDSSEKAVQDAFSELREREGHNFNAFMTQQVTNMSAAASAGHVNAAGLFRLKPEGEGAGVDYMLADKGYWQDSVTYATSEASKKTKGFKNAMDQVVSRGTDGKVKTDYRINSNLAKLRVAKLHSGMNKLRASNMNVMDVESWNSIIKNDNNTDKDIEDLFIMMAGEGVQEDAIEALVQRLDNAAKERYARVKKARGEAVKAVKEAAKKAEEEAEEELEGDKS